MAPLVGFKLELPSGKTFRVRSDTEITTEQTTNYLFNGGAQTLALFEQLAQDSSDSGGLRQSAYLGAGAGTHTVTVQGKQYVDSQDTWGAASPGDSPAAKRDELNNALNQERITSESPALLSFGEYSSDGRFDPLRVVIPQSTITVDTRSERSSVDVRLECAESADVSGLVHGDKQTED